MSETCALCDRKNVDVTKHHLIPRIRHNKKVKKEMTTKERNTTILFCLPCHNQLHVLFTEKELEREFNTLENLKAHPAVQKFIAWISKRPIVRLKVRE